MFKKKRRLTGLLMAAMLLGNTMAGAVPMTAYGDETAQISFKSETVCSQKEIVLEQVKSDRDIPYLSQTVNTAVYFSTDEDGMKWKTMEQGERESFLRSNATVTSSNDKILVSTSGSGAATVSYDGLTYDGKGIILSYKVYSKTKGANGTATLKLGEASSSTTIKDVVSAFGSDSNISGGVTIESVPFSIKQKESQEIQIITSGAVNAANVEWYSSNPEMISVTDSGNGAAVIRGAKLFPYPQQDSTSDHAVNIYAVVTTTVGVQITAKKSLFLKEGDPEFTLTNRDDQEFTLNTGDSKNIGVTVFPENASLGFGSVEIKGNQPDTATAKFDYSSKEIVVTAGSMEGTATFTVRAKINNLYCPAITITAHVQDPSKKIEITSDGESSDTILLDMEDSAGKLLTYRTVPDQAAVTDVIWSTKDKAVTITEHEDGTAAILPAAPGKAEIQLSAMVNGGLRKAVCTIYVLTAPEVTLKADGTETDHVFLVPQGTANLEAIAEDGYPAELKAETTFAWESSDETIATVSNAARTMDHRTVGAATPGNAAVTVKVTTKLPGVSGSQKTAEKTVNVEVEDIKLTGLVIPQDFTLKKGKTGTVSAVVQTDSETEIKPVIKDVTWESGSRKIVTVTPGEAVGTGNVKGIGEGKTTVGAAISVQFGGRRQTITASPSNAAVTIEPVPEVTFTQKSVTVKKGQEGTAVSVKASPSDASIGSVEWKSGNEEIAAVEGGSMDAVITGLKAGTTVVTAVVNADVNGENMNIPVAGQILVTVTEDSLAIQIKPAEFTVKAGDEKEIKLNWKASPSNALYDIIDVQWESGDESVAEVTGDESGAVVTGISAGTIPVRAIAEVQINGEPTIYEAETAVTVTEETVVLTVDPGKLDMKTGERAQLKLTASGSNAVRRITWSSDSEAAAVKDLDADGWKAEVSAQKEGTAVITASVDLHINGRDVTETITVPVTVTSPEQPQPDGNLTIELLPESSELKVGDKVNITLKTTATPSDTVYKIINTEWLSGNSKTASVAGDAKGAVVTGIAAGSTTIKVVVTAVIDNTEKIYTAKTAVTVKSNGSSGGNSGGSSGGSSGSSSVVSGSSSANYEISGTWMRDDNGWWLKQPGGSYPVSRWGKINHTWYYFGADGYLLTGWQFIDGNWYFLTKTEEDQGAMKSGWWFDTDYQHWFYLSDNGAMATGWQYINGNWYYFNPVSDGTRGAMASDTVIGSYRVNSDGVWIP